jgi:hypothetical protein
MERGKKRKGGACRPSWPFQTRNTPLLIFLPHTISDRICRANLQVRAGEMQERPTKDRPLSPLLAQGGKGFSCSEIGKGPQAHKYTHGYVNKS